LFNGFFYGILLTVISFSLISYSFADSVIYDKRCQTCIKISSLQKLEELKKDNPIVIWTSPTIYDHNSSIVVNGHSNRGDFPVTITVINPIGNIVAVHQETPNEDGSFELKLQTSSKLWKADGNYIISAHTGTEGGGVKVFRTQVLVLQDVGSDTLIKYEIDNGIVTGVTPNVETNSLIVQLSETTEDGVLKLYLPRNIIDAKLSSQELVGSAGMEIQRYTVQYDDEFIVTLDNKIISKLNENSAEVEFLNTIPVGTYLENTIIDHRIITIHYPAGAQTVEIQGTFVVPEFEAVAIMVLVLAIIPILVLRRQFHSLSYNFLK